jgi:hypothetical protein
VRDGLWGGDSHCSGGLVATEHMRLCDALLGYETDSRTGVQEGLRDRRIKVTGLSIKCAVEDRCHADSWLIEGVG